MSNPFSAIGHYFANLAKAVFGQLKVTIANFLHDFAKEELGKLAITAAQFANQSVGMSGSDKLALAKTKLLELVKDAGHDAASFGTSDLNFLLETALQNIRAEAGKGILALGEKAAA